MANGYIDLDGTGPLAPSAAELNAAGNAIAGATFTPTGASASPTPIRYALERRLDAEMFRADGRTDTQVLRLAMLAAIAAKVPLTIPARVYDCSATTGWLIDLTGADYFRIEAEKGAEIIVGDQGIRVVGTAEAEMYLEGLTITRATQATWNQNKTAVLLQSGRIEVKHTTISKFTDALTFQGTSTAPIKLLEVHGNELFLLGEEPIVVRQFVNRAVIRDNIMSRYLGDGILVKGARNVTISGNRLTAPAATGDGDYAALTAGQSGMPTRGGGITTNHEGGEAAAADVVITRNHIEDPSYGIGIVGAYSVYVEGNYLKNVRNTTGIAMSANGAFNPDSVPVLDYKIVNNTIDGMLRATQTSAIEAITGAVAVRYGLIAGNHIYGNPGVGHRGIRANNDVIVTGNTVRACQLSIDCGNNVQVTDNNILDEVANGRCITVGAYSTVKGNRTVGNSAIWVRGSNSAVIGNSMQLTGASLFCILDGVDTAGVVENVIIADNPVNPVGRGVGVANGASLSSNVIVSVSAPLVVGGAWNSLNPLQVGSWFHWYDPEGRLRRKASLPTYPNDGAVIGPSFGMSPLVGWFSDGSDGLLVDFTKTAQQFQENTGVTPADTIGQAIGLALDAHNWDGKTYAQWRAAMPEKITNGDFAASTGWTLNANASISGGKLNATTVAGGAAIASIGSVGAASLYLVTYTIDSITIGTGGGVSINFALGATSIVSGIQRNAPGTYSEFVAVPSAFDTIRMVGRGSGGITALSMDNLSVKDIASRNVAQATAGARPLLQAAGAKFDGTDDNLLTDYLLSAGENYIGAMITVPATLAATQVIAGASGASANRFFLAIDTSGRLCAGVGSDLPTTIVGTTDLRGQTIVVGLSADGTRVRLFEGDNQVYSAAQNSTPTTSIPVRLGALNDNGAVASPFAGSIRKIMVDRKAKTLAAHQQIRSAFVND